MLARRSSHVRRRAYAACIAASALTPIKAAGASARSTLQRRGTTHVRRALWTDSRRSGEHGGGRHRATTRSGRVPHAPYEFNRYFRPDRNPVLVTVVRRERISVPAGTFDAIVVRPTIKTTGIFSKGGRAEVWFADDSTRRMLQMESRLSFGTLSLYLRSVHP